MSNSINYGHLQNFNSKSKSLPENTYWSFYIEFWYKFVICVFFYSFPFRKSIELTSSPITSSFSLLGGEDNFKSFIS